MSTDNSGSSPRAAVPDDVPGAAVSDPSATDREGVLRPAQTGQSDDVSDVGEERPHIDEAERQRRFSDWIVPELPFLARVSRSMSRTGAQAEDLAQDTLLKAYRSIDRFDGRYPRAWLFRIARNTAINRDRRRREQVAMDEESMDRVPDREPGASDPAVQVDDAVYDELLENALDALPPDFRVLIQLVDVEGMRYQEAADLLDIPVGTVMSRLHRARRRLRAAVAGTHLDRSGNASVEVGVEAT